MKPGICAGLAAVDAGAGVCAIRGEASAQATSRQQTRCLIMEKREEDYLPIAGAKTEPAHRRGQAARLPPLPQAPHLESVAHVRGGRPGNTSPPAGRDPA